MENPYTLERVFQRMGYVTIFVLLLHAGMACGFSDASEVVLATWNPLKERELLEITQVCPCSWPSLAVFPPSARSTSAATLPRKQQNAGSCCS